MRHPSLLAASAAALALVTACSSPSPSKPTAAAAAPKGPMSFFVTSAGSGKGGNLGGLAGADAQCQKLASAAGAGSKTWRAYLSVPPVLGAAPVAAVNARDRIGKGPWFNAKGELIARDLTHLHDGNNISKTTALDERGNIVKGRGDNPNEHDILTGTRSDGTAFAPQTDTSCAGWTRGDADGSAIVGHHDRVGPNGENWATSWNFSHQTPGCSMEQLAKTGGNGRFYCFAAD